MKQLNFQSLCVKTIYGSKAVAVATILKYTNQHKAIRDHVDPEDKRKLSELVLKTKWNDSFPLQTGSLK